MANEGFRDHSQLLQLFLANRSHIVDKVQNLLNAQQVPVHLLLDRDRLSRQFEDCLYSAAAISPEWSRLRGLLAEAHWASGFKPRDMPQMHNDLVDPGEMMMRVFSMWRQTRWPGRNGRIRYAETLFNLYVIRQLKLLVMRLWDAGYEDAANRLQQVQVLLDQLWKSSPSDQPVLVRDARWLIPLAQSPATDDLKPYFVVAEGVAESLPELDRLEVHRASVLLAGGHLRSQLRHYNQQGVPLDDHHLVLTTRRSNALDFALTVQNLVPLLKAYGQAVAGGSAAERIALASAVCQGVSVDPLLFVCRVDLLGACTMIQHLFVAEVDGQTELTPMGRRHLGLYQAYAQLIGQHARALSEDCAHLMPQAGTYSPYGILFGFPSNILEHMALKSTQPEAETRFSIEDAFQDGDPHDGRLEWVSGWRRLPHVAAGMQAMYEYPQSFAEEVFQRIVEALQWRSAGDDSTGCRTGRIHFANTEASTGMVAPSATELPADYILSSDPQLVAAGRARFCETARLLHDRAEGEFLVSYQADGGWMAITKDVVTEVLGTGMDAQIGGLPPGAAEAIKCMYPFLIGRPR